MCNEKRKVVRKFIINGYEHSFFAFSFLLLSPRSECRHMDYRNISRRFVSLPPLIFQFGCDHFHNRQQINGGKMAKKHQHIFQNQFFCHHASVIWAMCSIWYEICASNVKHVPYIVEDSVKYVILLDGSNHTSSKNHIFCVSSPVRRFDWRKHTKIMIIIINIMNFIESHHTRQAYYMTNMIADYILLHQVLCFVFLLVPRPSIITVRIFLFCL